MELTRDNYFEFIQKDGIPVLHFSMLKEGIRMNSGNMHRLKAYYNKLLNNPSTKSTKFGHLVHGYAEDASKYVMMPDWKVSDNLKLIADKTFQLLANTGTFPAREPEVHDHEFQLACAEVDWNAKWKPETRMKKFKDDAGTYWAFLVDNADKIPITGQQVDQINGVISGIDREGIRNPVLEDTPGIETYREFPILFYIDRQFPSKVLIDKLEIDDEKKLAIATDIKTSAFPVESFVSRYTYVPNPHDPNGALIIQPISGSYVKFVYFLQEYFYKIALQHYLSSIGKGDYTIIFQFAVLENTDPIWSQNH